MRWAIKNKIECIKGNHEEFNSSNRPKFRPEEGFNTCDCFSHDQVTDPGHRQCLDELTEEEYEWMTNLPLYIRDETHNLLAVGSYKLMIILISDSRRC